MDATIWLDPPPQLVLPDGEIHVWRAPLDVEAGIASELQRSLSPDEKLRAERFHFERDRSHFVMARGLLRRLLAAYLDQEPSELRFQYGPYGKPRLEGNYQPSPLDFNLAHSHGQAVYAFARQRQVGIDVERIRSDFPASEIADRYFSALEIRELLELPLEQRPEAFFLGWTRKEAYIKAMGQGLHVQLDSFDVTLTPDTPARFLRGVDPQWRLTSFSVSKLFPGAVAYDGPISLVRFFTTDGIAL